MVTEMKARGPARPGLRPQRTRAAENGLLSVSAPKADAERVASVTPICTVARNRLGSASSRANAAPRRPCSDSVRTWDSRREISASSVPEKKPPIRTKTTTMTMLSQTSLTGGALLGGFGWGSPPHGAWSVLADRAERRFHPSVDPVNWQDMTLSSGTFRNRVDTVSLGPVTNRDPNFVRSPCVIVLRLLPGPGGR